MPPNKVPTCTVLPCGLVLFNKACTFKHNRRHESSRLPSDGWVEFLPGRTPGLAFFSMQDELSTILCRKVDLNTPNFLSRAFRDEVLHEARPLYLAA